MRFCSGNLSMGVEAKRSRKDAAIVRTSSTVAPDRLRAGVKGTASTATIGPTRDGAVAATQYERNPPRL